MTNLTDQRCEFWSRVSGFWPESADSALSANSGFWLFSFDFMGLQSPFQNPDGPTRILLRSLEIPIGINALEQNPESGKLPLKGWVNSPRTAGTFTAHPWAISRAAIWPIHRKSSSHPEEETMMVQAILTTHMREAIPDLPPAFRADRTVLALDLGTTTGWALHGADGLITSGTVSFRPSRFDGGGMRYLRFTNWLGELDRLSGPIAAVWFEEVRRHAGTDAAHVYGGLMATLTAWAELRGVPYEGVPVGTIKRYATGKGNADKEAMIAAARARGFTPADDNEADAIAILFWALETKGGLQ